MKEIFLVIITLFVMLINWNVFSLTRLYYDKAGAPYETLSKIFPVILPITVEVEYVKKGELKCSEK